MNERSPWGLPFIFIFIYILLKLESVVQTAGGGVCYTVGLVSEAKKKK